MKDQALWNRSQVLSSTVLNDNLSGSTVPLPAVQSGWLNGWLGRLNQRSITLVPLFFAAILGVGAVVWLLTRRRKAVEVPVQAVGTEPCANEVRRVMSHLGKRSGVVRGGKL